MNPGSVAEPIAASLLDGIRVVEIADGDFATAYAGRVLGQMGAQVLCVEPPSGSRLRSLGPFPEGVPDREKSAAFFYLNYNKKGITLNLQTPTGQAILNSLLRDSDVLLFSGTVAAGNEQLGSEHLSERHPRLVAACVSPFGTGAPWSDWKGADLQVSALGGASIGIGRPKDAPIPLPEGVAMAQGALVAVAGILSSLLARESDGLGDWVDAAAADVWATIHCNYILTFLYRDVTGIRLGRRGGAPYPDAVFECKDGQIVIDCIQLNQWLRLLELLGNPSWAEEPRYRDRRKMAAEYPDEVDALIQPWFAQHTREELWNLARQHRVPLAPIYSIEEVLTQPQLLSRKFFLHAEWEGRTLQIPGLPFLVEGARDFVTAASPRLGEHNVQVLEELGYSRAELIRLKAAGVI